VKDLELLRAVPLFSELDRKTLKRVGEAMSERTFAAGETIASEGEAGVGFFVIEDGRARVTIFEREVAMLGPGDHIGEMALIAESPRMATVVAETDIRAYGMTSWEFRRLAEGNAALAWKLLESTMKRVRELEQARADASQ
jgi:CRP-like cAMP-binding protein